MRIEAAAPRWLRALLMLIGGRLLRVDPKKLAITVIADGLPAGNARSEWERMQWSSARRCLSRQAATSIWPRQAAASSS